MMVCNDKWAVISRILCVRKSARGCIIDATVTTDAIRASLVWSRCSGGPQQPLQPRWETEITLPTVLSNLATSENFKKQIITTYGTSVISVTKSKQFQHPTSSTSTHGGPRGDHYIYVITSTSLHLRHYLYVVNLYNNINNSTFTHFHHL